ncbi:MAG: hypothetical protein GXP31_13825 [Kiritimatiellaeota bacterium]|nr:hypothetical protein [Kiritimatiellota bacterium]
MAAAQSSRSSGQSGQPGNLLLSEPEYKVTRTRFGARREYLYPDGRLFSEFRSRARLGPWPLVHITRGRCPSTGRRITARGVIAVGRIAAGGVAFGQVAVGLVAFGQLSFGLVAVGQAAFAAGFALGQLGVAPATVAQFGVGVLVVAQLGFGRYVLAQRGFGQFVYSVKRHDREVAELVRGLLIFFK